MTSADTLVMVVPASERLVLRPLLEQNAMLARVLAGNLIGERMSREGPGRRRMEDKYLSTYLLANGCSRAFSFLFLFLFLFFLLLTYVHFPATISWD